MMKSIQLKNLEIIKLLDSTLDIFYSEEVVGLVNGNFRKEKKDDLIPQYHPCSEEYLLEAFKQKLEDYSNPRGSLGSELMDMQKSNREYLNLLREKVDKLGKLCEKATNALTVIYPEDGYIGWHHNGNYPGHNVLFTYSLDGGGSFKYWNYNTNSIETIQDSPGWNVKVGYYPSQLTHRDRVYWHSAQTKKQRVSIGFVLDNEAVWQKMITKFGRPI